MSTNSKTIQVIGGEKVTGIDVEHREQAGDKKAKGVISRVKHLIGKVVTIEEDWILKSKDWPYLWDHKDTDNKA